MSSLPDRPRREFLTTAAGLVAGGLLASNDAAARPAETALPQRPFGDRNAKISILGLGGHHLGAAAGIDEAVEIVHKAIDAGVTFFDNCWEYYNGRSENWLGRALKGRRDQVFLMTKVCTHGRSAALALQMLDESLRRLGTDHLDLWQIHGVAFDDDPALAYARGGVLEALDSAKKSGKVRFVGFTGHKSPDVHLEMLTRGYPFDSVQMPLNAFDATFQSFERKVLPEVNRRGMASLGMKSLGGTAAAVKKGVLTAQEALRYAMSLPVATTICGIDSLERLEQSLTVARDFKPYSAEEMDALRARCRQYAGDGRFELYKVSLRYDNPEARLPHHFPLDPQNKEVKEMFKEAGAP